MKATKVIMPNGKERILIEVKPSEYAAVSSALWDAFMAKPTDDDKKEDNRYTAFARSRATDEALSFNDFVNRKDAQDV